VHIIAQRELIFNVSENALVQWKEVETWKPLVGQLDNWSTMKKFEEEGVAQSHPVIKLDRF